MRTNYHEPPPTGASLRRRRRDRRDRAGRVRRLTARRPRRPTTRGRRSLRDHRDTTLTVGLFGTFGFKEAGLWDAYKKVCPNITIKEDVVEQSADYWTRLKTRLASGSGLDDVQAIEIGFVADVVQNHADQFVNWNTVPNAAADKAEFYPWKWQLASTSDGTNTVGLGTDIGPEAICYRSDLLKQAGLPSDPATLAHEVEHVGRLHQLRQAVRGVVDQAVRLALRRQRGEHLLDRGLPGRRGVRQRRRTSPTSRTATA